MDGVDGRLIDIAQIWIPAEAVWEIQAAPVEIFFLFRFSVRVC